MWVLWQRISTSTLNSLHVALAKTFAKINFVSDLPLAISWSYHDIVAVGSDVGHSSWQVRWSGTCCLIISVIHRSASDLFDQHWRHSFSQCTGTYSAVEALCVMRYTSRQSSSSPHMNFNRTEPLLCKLCWQVYECFLSNQLLCLSSSLWKSHTSNPKLINVQ